MKIAVIVDVHGNIWAFDKVLEDIKCRSIDQFIILDDLVMRVPYCQLLKLAFSDLNHILIRKVMILY